MRLEDDYYLLAIITGTHETIFYYGAKDCSSSHLSPHEHSLSALTTSSGSIPCMNGAILNLKSGIHRCEIHGTYSITYESRKYEALTRTITLAKGVGDLTTGDAASALSGFSFATQTTN